MSVWLEQEEEHISLLPGTTEDYVEEPMNQEGVVAFLP
jgi:hypothetical protein